MRSDYQIEKEASFNTKSLTCKGMYAISSITVMVTSTP